MSSMSFCCHKLKKLWDSFENQFNLLRNYKQIFTLHHHKVNFQLIIRSLLTIFAKILRYLDKNIVMIHDSHDSL